MTSLPVVPSPAKGGSGYGLSYYSRYSYCPNAFWLDREIEARGGSLANTEKQDIGTLFHSCAEYFYRGLGAAILTSDYASATETARGLWQAFSKVHPSPEWFGNVLGAELSMASFLDAEKTVPLSGKADLVVELTKESVARLEAVGCYGPQPGQVCLVDHKTTSRRVEHWRLMYANSNQFALYCWLYEQQTGVKPCGTIANVVYFTKTKTEFEKVFVPAPSEAQVVAVLGWLSLLAEEVRSGKTGLSLNSCFTYGACGHLLAGRCTRC